MAHARRPRIFIVAYSEVARDARVLREARYLSRSFDVVLAGWGSDVMLPGVEWHALPSRRSLPVRILGHVLLLLGRVLPAAHDWWYHFRPAHVAAAQLARRERCDVYYANDWVSLPAAAEGAGAHGGRLVLDAHEYSPLEWENSFLWRLMYRPLVLRVLRRYASRCDASITVSQPIAERYAREFPLKPIVVLNAPEIASELPEPQLPGEIVRLVHHGSAIRERRLELMIDVMARAERRYTLDLMLLGDAAYIEHLRRYAERTAPGRVRFVPPVRPAEIVRALSAYDAGIYLLEAEMYNHAMALPNKVFDFVAAGLAVVIGPSPAMRDLVLRHGFGRVSPSMAPEDCATLLAGLTREDILAMRHASARARRDLNADVEMAKLVKLVESLVPSAN